MTIGIDIGLKNICGALLHNNQVINQVDKSIYDQKRDCSRVIMAKLLSLIQELFAPQVKGIGLSLPSKVDEKRGVVFDIEYIPYWKKARIKTIVEETFNVPTIVNTDINCYVVGEKYYGICKDFHNILCITVEPNVNVGVIVNDNVYMENKETFEQYTCLSTPSYHCVRNYKKSYTRTLEDLNDFTHSFSPDKKKDTECAEWGELGTMLGRLITIMLSNYEPQIVVLGGHLAKGYPYFAHALDKYIERYIHPQILLNLIIVAAVHDNACPLGAAKMASEKKEAIA